MLLIELFAAQPPFPVEPRLKGGLLLLDRGGSFYVVKSSIPAVRFVSTSLISFGFAIPGNNLYVLHAPQTGAPAAE